MKVLKLRGFRSISLMSIAISISTFLFSLHGFAGTPESEGYVTAFLVADAAGSGGDQLKFIVILLIVFAFIAMFGLVYLQISP